MGPIAVLYDGKPIQARTPFDAPDDWLKHITIAIKNESAKTLTGGFIQLAFPGIGGDPMLFYYVHFGKLTKLDRFIYSKSRQRVPPPEGEPPVSVPPGEHIILPLASEHEAIQSAIAAKAPQAQATLVVVDYGAFNFDGGLRWMLNSFRREDPSTPGNYIPTPREDLMAKPGVSGP